MTTFPDIVANNKEKHVLKPGEGERGLYFSEFGRQIQIALSMIEW